ANQPKKYKKFVATAATATLVASAIVPVASAASLSDIAGNTHEEAITALVDAGVINGYPDGTFQPNKTLTRSDVVKLLGKFLVSKGHEVPADYKTNVRFNDLTSASNDELLKYAAVVYDAGVFNGSNGNLLAADNITRENMAVVLVRAFDTLNNIDLVSYVQDQDYKKDVKDLYTAKAEARSAIEVLDFFDITNPAVANFNPKGSTTRGHFATFLYNTMNADFSAVTGVANSAVSEIKAINNTTVEVTFKETVENIEALDFTIEGLEVTNAVVKQTDAKTVVLTTAPQTGDTVYTVNVNAAKAGTFKGISAVVPTAVTMTTPSVQGKLGQQVTVKAQVTVAEGQSKAGIPVTLFVPGSADGIKAPVTVEAVTNADGVATYTYTRYAATTDTVTAYASGDRSKFATGYVFWGVDTILTVEEVTTGSTINNGANKTYKVTFKDDVTGQPKANTTLNVSFLENINVTSDKLANAKVNGVEAVQLSNGSVLNAAQITTDSKGEATFTVSGANTTVTPVVYALHPTTSGASNKTYAASALQATAPKVTFAAIQAEYTIELTRDGNEVAARGYENGRVYKVLVKDKDGKVAANEVVNIALNEDLDGIISTDSKGSKFVELDADGNQIGYVTSNNGKQISVKTNSKGEASFVISSETQNDYATPVAWIDVNSAFAGEGKLDQGEPKTIGQISYFTDEYLDGASLAAYKGEKKSTKFEGTEIATFKTELVNQSGQEFGPDTDIEKVSYTVFNTGANNVVVYNQDGSPQVVSPNRSYTTTYNNGADLTVQAEENKSTSVRVVATGVADYNGKDFAFTAKEATATFTSTTAVTDTYTGKVAVVTTSGLTFEGKAVESFSSTTKFFGGNGSEVFGAQNFVNEIQTLAGENNAVTVTLIKDSEGNKTFKVVSASQGTAPVTSNEIYVTKTAATPAADTYKIGDTVSVTLTFSENVNIGADETIQLGGQTLSLNAAVANANTATFTATLGAGDDNSAATLDLSDLDVTDADGTKVFNDTLVAVGTNLVKKFDLSAPTVAVELAAPAEDVANGSLVFSEAINSASRTAVKAIVDAAYSKNGDATVTSAWAADNKTLTITVTKNTGTVDLVALEVPASFRVTDLAGNVSEVLTLEDLQIVTP
ncbi:MAG: S-layer homology domain-containing protein, partial [Psychrobacillus psychrodurans]